VAQPVWALHVDLETKTATFQSGLADAARAARGSFSDIKDGASEMARETEYSMTEARHGVMLLGEEFGVHIPRALTSFIASLGPIGGAMEAAFPFLALIAGATLLIEHLNKIREAGQQNAAGWAAIGDASEQSLQQTEKEIKKVVNATAELTGGKLVALKHKLEDIDEQKFDHLLGNFNKVSSEIDKMLSGEQRGNVMTALFGQNVEGDLKEGFDKFKVAYSSLLQSGDTKLAAEALEKEIGAVGRKFEELRLQAQNVTAPGLKEDVANTQALYNTLIDLGVQREKDIELSEKQKVLAHAQSEGNDNSKEWAEGINRSIEKMMNSTLEWAKVTRHAAGESSQALHQTEEYFKAVADAAKKAAQDELQAATHTAENEAEVRKAQLSQVKAAIADAESSGLISRTSAIHANMELIRQETRVRLQGLEQEMEAKQRAIEAEIAADQRAASQTLAVNGGDKADPKYLAFLTDVASKKAEIDAITQKYGADAKVALIEEHIQLTNLSTDTEKLKNTWHIWLAQSTQDTKSLSATIRGELQTSIQSMTTSFAQGFAKSVVEGKSFTHAMQQEFRSLAERGIESMLEWGVQDLMTKLRQRAAAAQLAGANATASQASAPWPLNMSAPAAGAAAFASAMAFEEGGIVPGVGKGDTVPAMLEPGEGVLSNKQMESLRDMSARSESSGGQEIHVHHHITNHIQALDSSGFAQVLDKHADALEDRFKSTLRRMNK
jgi:hypothetical protein